MYILPHLPAPTAVHDPLNGHAARAARTAAQRIGAQEPVVAYSKRGLRRDPLRLEAGEHIDRFTDDESAETRSHRDRPNAIVDGTTSLFFAQRFAQEEYPASQPSVAHETATSAYPSLGFDDDILRPGETVRLGWFGTHLLDILVLSQVFAN